MGHFAGLDVSVLPLQADWIGSRAAVAMALQRSCRGRVTGGLCRDAAHAGSAEVTDQQEGPQRCTRQGDQARIPGVADGLARPQEIRPPKWRPLSLLRG
jgi:hypothetical protein